MTLITESARERAARLQQQYRAGIDTATSHGGVEFWLGMTLACNATLATLELLSMTQHDDDDRAAHSAAYTRHQQLCQPTQPPHAA
jgi:hypothetical protein